MEIVKEFWAVIAGIVAWVAWSVRLEAGMLANRKDIRRIEDERKEDNRRADAQRSKMEEKLDRINDRVQQVLVILENKADRK